ncbi:hypothetical protein MKW94_021767 [Papaver nudicaule]|uniref:Uncharacterized protein n=1 Tax=Papaver nudicaule TaxID=74823 RepID=A0AA41SJ25_PAPNU|nr:hypothetical protein [Papaver nudicaule]
MNLGCYHRRYIMKVNCQGPGHRFEFKLYALDDIMHLGHKVTKEKLIDAIEGHMLGEAVPVSVF